MSYLGSPTHIPNGMVEKGLERESDDVIVCDLKVATLIAEMLLLLSRSIPIGKCLVRNERCEATETK